MTRPFVIQPADQRDPQLASAGLRRRSALAASALVLPTALWAQAAWPRQSIRFVVPFAPPVPAR